MLNEWPEIDKELKSYFNKYDDHYFFSEKCCDFIKGNLKHDKRPSFIGTMVEESEMRKKSWINQGCNIINEKIMKSRPLSIWTKNDIWTYIKQNNIPINPAYGFDYNKEIDQQNLRFDRLGCTSCPYGSSIEQKLIDKLKETKDKKDPNNSYKKMNRFEILFNDYPNLYKAQVIMNGMYKILIDMGIKIQADKNYMKLYELRWKDINNWYDKKNIKNNILRIMIQIESYSNKFGSKSWKYTINDFKQAMNHFDQIENKNITLEIINELRKEITSIKE